MQFDYLRQDLRYALRSFGRSPIFALTAVLSLALGIGADTAVLTIANSLLLRPPAGVTGPDRLIDISGIERDDTFGVNEISFPILSTSAAAPTAPNGSLATESRRTTLRYSAWVRRPAGCSTVAQASNRQPSRQWF
jgi:hypothetical protein